jgi:16S rRNA (uracil1498-N3)-methyltransferase
MTRRRWIADEFSHDRAALTGEHAAHLSRTLRARIGQEFDVACGDRVRRATVSSVSDDRVEFTLGEEVTARKVVPITLLLAIFKFDRMEWAIEKCTELNVTTIIPVVASRTEKHLAMAAAKRVERWRRIAREASEQSRRISPPEISGPLTLKDALELKFECEPYVVSAEESEVQEKQPRRGELVLAQHPSAPLRAGYAEGGVLGAGKIEPSPVGTAQVLKVVLAETEREAMLSAILRAQDNLTSLALAIGSEGGWTSEELQTFEQSHWLAASLGDTILRAETAAIAALAIARAEV